MTSKVRAYELVKCPKLASYWIGKIQMAADKHDQVHICLYEILLTSLVKRGNENK